jgi:hypothetical protein
MGWLAKVRSVRIAPGEACGVADLSSRTQAIAHVVRSLRQSTGVKAKLPAFHFIVRRFLADEQTWEGLPREEAIREWEQAKADPSFDRVGEGQALELAVTSWPTAEAHWARETTADLSQTTPVGT